ncbi:MAG: hypothetical protein IKR40_01525 [Treponema sp.]|nr:hypothetical protein [Treponema sp.]
MKSFIAALVQTILVSLAIIFTAFLIPTPLFCILILVLVPLALLIRWLVFKKNKGTIFLTVFSIIALLFFALCLESNPYTFSSGLSKKGNEDMQRGFDSLTASQAMNDLDFVMHRVKKIHPAAYKKLPKTLSREWEKVRDELEGKKERKEEISKIELAQKIEGILSLLNDAHTNVSFSFVDSRYLKHVYAHTQAKDTLISVNGKTKREIFEENRNLFSTENDEYAISRIGNYVTSIEGLSYLNLVPESLPITELFDEETAKEMSAESAPAYTYTFEHVDGSQETYAYPLSDFVSYDEYMAFNSGDNSEEESDKAEAQPSSFVHYEINADDSIGIFTLDSCIFNDVYKSTLKSFFDDVKEKKIRNLIVDLRNNAGGNSLVANEFLRYTNTYQYRECACDHRMGPFTKHFPSYTVKNERYEGYNFDGKIYVLTSVHTFSSAMMFAMYIKDNNLGLVVGEASGNNPSSYGDVVQFRLPESRLYMQVSWKKWYRIDESKDGQLIEPDLPVKADDALSYVTELIAGPKLPAPESVEFENAETDTESDSAPNEPQKN